MTTGTPLHHTTSSSCGWGDHCNHCNHSKNTISTTFRSINTDSLCHPWFTTTNLSYRFPVFETSATALRGTTGTVIPALFSESAGNMQIGEPGVFICLELTETVLVFCSIWSRIPEGADFQFSPMVPSKQKQRRQDWFPEATLWGAKKTGQCLGPRSLHERYWRRCSRSCSRSCRFMQYFT